MSKKRDIEFAKDVKLYRLEQGKWDWCHTLASHSNREFRYFDTLPFRDGETYKITYKDLSFEFAGSTFGSVVNAWIDGVELNEERKEKLELI
jgi:hypothetical protein